MISFEFTDGKVCPVLTCDFCGKRVRSGSGIVACLTIEKPEALCFHKGKCDTAWSAKHGETEWWQEIEEFLIHLTFNAAKDAPNTLSHIQPSERAEINEWRTLRPRLAPIVFRRDGNKCTYCGSTKRLTVDHIKPLSQGGSHDLSNLTTACRQCNSSKGAASVQEWQV